MLNKLIFTLFLLINISVFSQDFPKYSSITGKWRIINENGFSCNVCPKIEFNYDDLGFIELPNGEILSFTWQLNDSVLNFKFNEKRYFPIDTLYLNFSFHDSIEVLILSSEINIKPINYNIIKDNSIYNINISNWIYKLMKLK